MTTLSLDIYQEVLTIQDVIEFKKKVDNFSELLFETRGDFEKKITESFSKQQSEAIIREVHRLNIPSDDIVHLRRFIKTLKAELDTLPTITIFVAVELPYSTVKHIGYWIEQQLSQKIILDLQLDTKLLGGIAVYKDGVYLDFSIRKQLENMADRGELRISNLLA